MVDIVISIASKVAEYLVAPISQRAAYLFCFNQFIGDVDKAKQELEVKLADVEKRKEEADRKTEEIMPSVKKWLDDVNAILEEVQKLQQELEGGGNKCFNVSRRYSLAKQMDKAKQMMDLKQNSIFEPFSQLKQLPGILNISSKGFMDFNSRKSTYNCVLKAIKDDNEEMVGLYGIGGSGKTTLAKQVGREMDELKFVDKVVFTVISKPTNVLNIQQQIAEQIGLPLHEVTQPARAERLAERLKNMKILLILDDVWEYLSLEDVGIPLFEGCHILLTTRQRNVCVSMNCEPIIELPLIAKEEAWELFKKHANLFGDASGEFHHVGRKIIDECKELPIAIVTVGSSLKGKGIEAWESALWKLKYSLPLNIEPGLRSPYACLELSYDNLPNSTTKLLFLLCSMFPEDHAIHKEDLIRFGKRTIELEDFIGTMEDVRREIVVALGILLDSCLLMSTDERACVKMHDLVRDVALWIAKKEGQEILVDSHAISNILLSNVQSLKHTKALSLWNLDRNFKLFNQLHCPTLEIMLLQPHGLIEDLQAIDALKVLALITFSFTWKYELWPTESCSIPQSMVSLTNLQTLCLRGKNLGDISFLGKLKRLEILDLRNSTFHELPAAIVDMKMLKILDIFRCDIENSPLEVIGRCEQLEELYFLDRKSAISENFSPSRFKRANFLWLNNCGWDHKDINYGIKHLCVSCGQEKRFIIDNRDVNVQQIQVFSHLVTLSLFEMENLEQVFPETSINCSTLERLSDNDEAAQGNPLLHAEQDYPRGNETDGAYVGLTTKSPTTQIVSFHRLEKVELLECPKLKNICTLSTITSLPELRCVEVVSCEEWEGIFCGQSLKNLSSTIVCFPKLEMITVRYCHNVKRLFSYSLASHCPSLKAIFIYHCSQIESVVQAYEGEVLDDNHERLLFSKSNDLDHESMSRLRDIHPNYGNEIDGAYVGLTAKRPATEIVSFHRLERIELAGCPKLKNIFTLSIVTSLPELRQVKVSRCEEWEGIFCMQSLNLSSTIICFPKLEMIEVRCCYNLKRLFSYSLASQCPSLKKIIIYDCFQLEGIVQAHEGEVVDDHYERLLFPKLNDLDLKNLPKLREIYPGYEFNHIFGTISIRDCPNILNVPLEFKASSELEI